MKNNQNDHDFAEPLPVMRKANGTYSPPAWSSRPTVPTELEVIKAGVVLENRELMSREYFVLGRQNDPSVHLLLEHPSISRQHAVLQFKHTGQVYLFDLGSTWGSYVNMKRIPPREYVEVVDGDILKFGESTRTYILTQPGAEEEEDDVRGQEIQAAPKLNIQEKLNHIK
jgi:pSer/pThr/pTyr-binding forkhead associated (FHA) protein